MPKIPTEEIKSFAMEMKEVKELGVSNEDLESAVTILQMMESVSSTRVMTRAQRRLLNAQVELMENKARTTWFSELLRGV